MKKLLILGTSVGSTDIVKYAKEQGVYTIVADNLPPEKSAAKRIADEGILISTGDIPTLVQYAKDNGVDAAFAGVSEFNIESARKVNEALGVKFYYTREQWNTFMNKGNFRSLCGEYGVKTPYTFFSGAKDELKMENLKNNIQYPVIVKPVDNGANIGVSVCKNADTLDEAISLAFSSSDSGRIIIERFIEGPEISTTYVIQNRTCKLVCMGTKYAYKNEKGLQALAHGYIYPSPCLEEYLQESNQKIIKMILDSGLDNCTVFFQGIYNNHGFYIFEAGLRMEGTATFRITEAMNGQNFMKFLVDSVLRKDTSYNINLEDATFSGRKCFIFSLIAKEGTVAKIEGTEHVQEDPSIISFEQRHYVGTTIRNDGTLRQIMFRFSIKNDNVYEVAKTINWIKNTIKVFDSDGNDMLIKSFDPKVMIN